MNKKPIFAILILIAITVIAGVVAYMFTLGYLASVMKRGATQQEIDGGIFILAAILIIVVAIAACRIQLIKNRRSVFVYSEKGFVSKK